jgi:predicted phosphodiesterase
MRYLLLSDTHGKLGIINELAAEVYADAVIHAGDFGFYDEGSCERISDRELRLHIAHSELEPGAKKEILGLSHEEKNAACREMCPLSELPMYIDGRRRFEVPLYAVWGNHEDKMVVKSFVQGDLEVENLHVLAHCTSYRVGPALVYGLGGNFLPGSKLLQKPVAGGAGRVWSTLSQYLDLIQTVDCREDQSETRIFVSHASPGKEPFVEFIAARTSAEITVSGHMGAPCPMVWNPFAVRSVEEASRTLQQGILETKRACLEARGSDPAQVEQAFSVIDRIPETETRLGRGVKVPRWYCRMTHINLPDADVGYAVLDLTEEGAAIRTSGRP